MKRIFKRVIKRLFRRPLETECEAAFARISRIGNRIPRNEFDRWLFESAWEAAINAAGERAFLQSYEATKEGLDMSLKGSAIHILTSALAGQFEGSGATNYLEVKAHHTKLGPFLINMQRLNGKTPAQLRTEAEAQRDSLKSVLADLLQDLDDRAVDVTPNPGQELLMERARKALVEVQS